MVIFFLYNHFANIEVIKQINTNYEINDGYIIMQSYDDNVLKISDKTVHNNKILHGKIVKFNMNFNDVVNKITEIEEYGCKHKSTNEVHAIWAVKSFGGVYKAYIMY